MLLIGLRFVWHDGVWALVLVNMFTLYVFLPVYPVAIVCVWHLGWAVTPLVPRTPPQAAGETLRVVTGDFNSTPYSRFAAAMDRRDDDAWDLAGAGYGHTAPNGLFPLPPIRLDHVYVSESLTVTSAEMGIGTGSDHRPLIVEVGLRR